MSAVVSLWMNVCFGVTVLVLLGLGQCVVDC